MQLKPIQEDQWESAIPALAADSVAAPPGGQAAQYETLPDLLAVLRRYRITIAIVALAVFVPVLLACLVMKPQYASTAVIEVNRDTPAAQGVDGNSSSSGTQSDDLQTEVSTDATLLQDSGLALEVIHKLSLETRPPYDRLAAVHGAPVPLDADARTRQKVIRKFEKSLKVQAVPDTQLIDVTFRNQNPAIAASVANTLCASFISNYLNQRLNATSEVSYWIGKQLDTLKKQVESSEQALADYERKTGLSGVTLDPSQSGDNLALEGHSSTLDRLSALNQDLTTAEAARISSEAVYKLILTQDPEVVLGLGSMSIASGGTVLGQGGGLDLLRNLRAQEVPLKTEYAEESVRYGSKNPRLIELKNQINMLDSEIRAELGRITKRAENDYFYAVNNEKAIHAEVRTEQGAADKLNSDSAQLQVLAQQAYSNRKLYEGLLSQLHEADVAAGIHATHLTIVNRGEVTGIPVAPDYLLILPIAGLAGIVLGITAAFIRQSMDQSVSVPQDVERTVQLPVMAHLPLFDFRKSPLAVTPEDSVLLATPQGPLSEAFRSLRTSIQLSRPSAASKVLLIASPLPGDGKSTVAFNLAVAFAQQKHRVLLIDGDMRNPDLHPHFGVANGRGLTEAVTSPGAGLDELLIRHRTMDSLFLVRAGDRTPLPNELFNSEAFDRLLAEARARFDWILIDSPPFLPFSDTALLATAVDAVVPVIRAGSISRNMLPTIATHLRRMRAPVIGLVLNAVKEDKVSLFYSYGYYRERKGDKYANLLS